MPCPWLALVAALAQWAMNLVVRRDVHGKYIPPDRRKDPGKAAFMEPAEPTEDVLAQHFSGNAVIGLYTTGDDSLSRMLVIDIDRHDERGSHEANERAAIALHDRAVGMGLSAFLEDSNGRGGYKLWLVFRESVPAAVLRRFGKWLIRDWEDRGLEREPEVFPKQDKLRPGRVGNFIRLPGRHHTHDFWSRIWGGAGWLEGEAAARRILATAGSAPELIPAKFCSEPAGPSPAAGPGPTEPGRRAGRSEILLDLLRSAADALPADFPGSYDLWLKAGMALFDLGDDGLAIWERISRGCPRYRPGACPEKWRTFKSGEGVTYRTILWFAIQNGWKPTRRRHRVQPGPPVDHGSGQHPPTLIQVDHATVDQKPAKDADTAPEEADEVGAIVADGPRSPAAGDSQGRNGHPGRVASPATCGDRAISEVVDDKKTCPEGRRARGNGKHRPERLGEGIAKRSEVEGPAFEYTDSGLYRLTSEKEGIRREPLTNFGARIVAELTVTDGDRTHKEFRIEAKWPDGGKVVQVLAEEFERMNWVYRLLGARAIVKAGLINKDRAREAIQSVSAPIEQVTVYTHTGFVQVGGDWYFLHAGGAIGAAPGPRGAAPGPGGSAEGEDRPTSKLPDLKDLEPDGPIGPLSGVVKAPKKIEVRLPSFLAGYRLPEPPTGQELVDAVRSSLRFLELPEELVTYPLYALTWVAPLGIGNFTVHLDGSTGKNKSVRAGLIQQHYGQDMNFEHLPSSWSSTSNALEGGAYQCKDCVLTVDDWVLQGSRSDHEQAQRAAAHLIRAAANQAGRQRSSRDGTPNAGRPPRGPILITGEATPSGHSINARLIRLEVTTGLLSPEAKPILDRCQADADAGLYAQAMAGYIQYVASRYDQLRREMPERVDSFREELRTRWKCRHPRTATILGKLMAAFEVFLEFASDIGAIDKGEFRELFHRQGDALVSLVGKHNRHLQSTDPWDQFIELLSAAILSGVAHLENRLGGHPIEDPGAWGWRAEIHTVRRETSAGSSGEPVGDDGAPGDADGGSPHQGGENHQATTPIDKVDEFEERMRWRPQGARIGWIHRGRVYLLPTPSLVAAQAVAERLGVRLPLTEKTLGRTAHEKGKLLESDIDSPRNEYTTRHTILGKRPKVYVMEASTIIADSSAFWAFEDMDEDEQDEAMRRLLDPGEARQRESEGQMEA